MEFLPADYVLGAFAMVMAVMGMFRGLSGTLAFLVACGVSIVVGSTTWPYSETLSMSLWARGGITLLAVLLSFGVVRIVVRKLVNGILAQPADAIFGSIAGLLVVGLVVVGWAYIGTHLEYSNIASMVATYVR